MSETMKKPIEAWAVVDKDGALVDLDHLDSEDDAQSVANAAGHSVAPVMIVPLEEWERLNRDEAPDGLSPDMKRRGD